MFGSLVVPAENFVMFLPTFCIEISSVAMPRSSVGIAFLFVSNVTSFYLPLRILSAASERARGNTIDRIASIPHLHKAQFWWESHDELKGPETIQ
jgi:hypothetical protein